MRRLLLPALALLALTAVILGPHGRRPPRRRGQGTAVTVSPSGTVTLDVDATQELTLTLGVQPSGDVTVILVVTDPAVAGLSIGDGEPAARVSLTFPVADWQTAQKVTLTGLGSGTAIIARQVGGGVVGSASYYVQRVKVNAPVGHRTAPADDCAADATTTCSIKAPTSTDGPATARGEIELLDDVDWFSVSFASGGQYRIEMQGSYEDSANTLRSPRVIGIYDASGALVPGTTYWSDGTIMDEIAFQSTGAATHYIALSHFAAWPHIFNPVRDAGRMGTYTLRISRWPEDDCIEAPSTTCVATVGAPFTGEIQGTEGDDDWIGVDLTAGTAYQIDVEGRSTDKGTLLDPRLDDRYHWVDDEGRWNVISTRGIVREDVGVGLNERALFKARRTGRYHFVVSSHNARRNGTYAFTVTELTSFVDDFSDDRSGSSIGAITLTDGSGTATGTIEMAGDKDWFQVQLTGRWNYFISQNDRYNRLGYTGLTLGGAEVGIHNASGQELVRSRYPYSRFTFTPTETGTYYILARHGVGFKPTGTYNVSVRQLPADDIAGDTSTASSVTVGGSVSGVIGTLQDVDWHRAQLAGGTEYVFDIAPHYSERDARYGKQHSLLGFSMSSNVFFDGVYDSGGNAVSDGVSFGDSPYRLLFTPATTGAYYVATRTYDPTAPDTEQGHTAPSQLGDYTVSLQTSADAGPDDFPADSSTTAVVTASQPLEGKIDYIYDVDYVRVSLQPGKGYTLNVIPYRNWKLEEIPGSNGRSRFVEQPDSGKHSVSQRKYLHTTDGRRFYGTYAGSGSWGSALYCYEVETADDFFFEVQGSSFGIGRYDVSMAETAGKGCKE